jgi:hypothetical protein
LTGKVHSLFRDYPSPFLFDEVLKIDKYFRKKNKKSSWTSPKKWPDFLSLQVNLWAERSKRGWSMIEAT